MLNINNLSFSYGDTKILENISFLIKEGDVISLLGSNGSGKSTLLNIISKNLKNFTGEVLLNDKNIDTIGLRDFSKNVAIVHQKNTAPDDITVERLVAYGRTLFKRKKVMKIIFMIIGFITLGLGIIGAIFPILPTTPFLLVSAFCFAKSSEKLNIWFKNTKIYKNNLASFVKGEGMTVKTKVKILIFVTILLGFAAFMMRNVPYGFLFIGAVWLAHIIGFVFFLKTAKEAKNCDK